VLTESDIQYVGNPVLVLEGYDPTKKDFPYTRLMVAKDWHAGDGFGGQIGTNTQANTTLVSVDNVYASEMLKISAPVPSISISIHGMHGTSAFLTIDPWGLIGSDTVNADPLSFAHASVGTLSDNPYYSLFWLPENVAIALVLADHYCNCSSTGCTPKERGKGEGICRAASQAISAVIGDASQNTRLGEAVRSGRFVTPYPLLNRALKEAASGKKEEKSEK